MKAGQAALDFTLPTQRGVSTTLSTVLKGGPALIAFPGRIDRAAGHQRVLELARLYTAALADGRQMLVIVPNRQAIAKRYVEEVGTPFHLLCDEDGAVATRYGVRRNTPAMFLVDTAGIIIEISEITAGAC
jgi:thioredoxin-dependent peroxiredoxin